jgi:hypothetical protein
MLMYKHTIIFLKYIKPFNLKWDTITAGIIVMDQICTLLRILLMHSLPYTGIWINLSLLYFMRKGLYISLFPHVCHIFSLKVNRKREAFLHQWFRHNQSVLIFCIKNSTDFSSTAVKKATDTDGLAHKVLFTQARVWRKPNNATHPITLWSILILYSINQHRWLPGGLFLLGKEFKF